MNNPVEIAVKASEKQQIKLIIVLLSERRREYSLLKDMTIVENPDSCIIFCRTKDHVDNIIDQLDLDHYTCDKIHGGMDQEDRFQS